MEILEKALPFLTQFPRWLQLFFFAVLLQALALLFLGTVYAFKAAATRAQPASIKAVAAEAQFQRRASQSPGTSAAVDPVPSGLQASVMPRSSDTDFPIRDVTVLNSSDKPHVLTAFDVVVVGYQPYASIPESRVLTPIALVDVQLPLGTGTFPHGLSRAILVAPNDAITMSFRFSVRYGRKPIPPRRVAGYTLRVVLRTQSGYGVSTQEFVL